MCASLVLKLTGTAWSCGARYPAIVEPRIVVSLRSSAWIRDSALSHGLDSTVGFL